MAHLSELNINQIFYINKETTMVKEIISAERHLNYKKTMLNCVVTVLLLLSSI